ncbi:MAG: O-methyltransferase [Kiritimatiellia bacterium]|jgi:O-methyltransferase
MHTSDHLARTIGRLRAQLKLHVLAPLLYRHPPVGLMPDRLYAWLHALTETANVPGAIVEVGCNVGGTAAVASRFLQRAGITREYVAIDTFDGFVPSQFQRDQELGNSATNRHVFRDNSRQLARYVIDRHGGSVRLVTGDIVTMPDAELPDRIAAALIDVDLAEPVEAALERLWPRLLPGGVILVDDCPPTCDWQARRGYLTFAHRHGLDEQFRFDMARVQRDDS